MIRIAILPSVSASRERAGAALVGCFTAASGTALAATLVIGPSIPLLLYIPSGSSVLH